MRLEAKQPPAGKVFKRLSGFQGNAAKHTERGAARTVPAYRRKRCTALPDGLNNLPPPPLILSQQRTERCRPALLTCAVIGSSACTALPW